MSRKLRNIILVSISIIVVSTYLFSKVSKPKKRKKKKKFKVEVEFKKEGELTINNNLKFDIEIAKSDFKTERGLMYRSNMKNNRGMLFIFPDEDYRSFYMKNTRIYLDIIFINSKKEIIHIHKNAKPYDESSVPSIEKAMYVFEINGGLSDKLEIKKGNKIDF